MFRYPFCFAECMELYDMKARGSHSPLNAREIAQLYRFGQLSGRHSCKPRGEAKWRTVDELFPLLRYEASAPPLRFDNSSQIARRRKALLALGAFLVALLGMTAAHFWNQSEPAGFRESDNQSLGRPNRERVDLRTTGIGGSAPAARALGEHVIVAEQRPVR